MSHISADSGGTPLRRFPQLAAQNIAFPAGSGKSVALTLMVLGLAAIALAGIAGIMGIGQIWARQVLAAYHIGTMAVLAMCLGALFFVMVFHLTNAGWTGTIRRQFENVMSFLPFAVLMIVPTLVIEIALDGRLFAWMGEEATHNFLMQKKAPFFFLNQEFGPGLDPFPLFWVLRSVLYLAVWTFLSRRLIQLSREQDRTASSGPTAKARFLSAWGLLVFALTTAFAAFDWLMSMDYTFFSTMWGVYYFAGAAFSSAGLMVLIFAVLRSRGKLEGAVLPEHFHDMGKLMFTFTIFWSYIAFSQYFLIWYSNIPEETAFYLHRNAGPWKALGVFLIFGHFVIPFLILLFRKVKRNYRLLSVMAVWAILVEVADLYWIVRPMVYAKAEQTPGAIGVAVDVLAIAGVLAIFAGYLVLKVPAGPLVAVNDLRMEEALGHKNYV